jgi:hypothetical protein
MTFTPMVNTEARMSAKMLHALNRLEVTCAVTKVGVVTEKRVRDFLTENYGAAFAAQFRPEYLLSTRVT